MGRVRFVTFGCKANQYDTQLLREALLRRGFTEEDRDAELVVVNTCTVTAEAGRKARQLIRRLSRERADVRIAVTGCLAESEPEVLRELPGVSWVLGNGEAKRPAHFLRDLGVETDPEELGIPSGITEFAGHTRAFCKIQDGCDKRCAFCIIPHVRGPSRSRGLAELEGEVRRLVLAGHVEVVLCGIHIGHWGLDLGLELADLVEALCALEVGDADGAPRPFRLRLSSIEATEVTPRLLGILARRPDRVAPHLHMPMQSGDDEVLAAMNRWYTTEEYLAACERIRAALERPAFTADVLVGFPGEEERHFERTLETVRRAGFARVHAFPFSPRPGTAAFELPGRPAPEAVRERRARLAETACEIGRAFRLSLDGARDTVVLEGGSGLSGRYQRVRVAGDGGRARPGDLVEVRLEARRKGPVTAAEGPVELEALEGDVELVGRPLSRSGVPA